MTTTVTTDLVVALEELVSASERVATAWESVQADEREADLSQLVSELRSLREATEPLALVDSDLSGLIYDLVWKDEGTFTADVGDAVVAVSRSKSYSTDGAKLLGAIAARMADELEGVRMVDEDGEMVPPGPAVERVVNRLAELSSLKNKSQAWAKTKLAAIGIDLEDYRETSRGAKRVKIDVAS